MAIVIQTLYTQTALEFLLQEKYFAEFEVIDGYNQHPKGLNFYEWLYEKKLIPKAELIRVSKIIKEEEENG